jgi:hypothetical protein
VLPNTVPKISMADINTGIQESYSPESGLRVIASSQSSGIAGVTAGTQAPSTSMCISTKKVCVEPCVCVCVRERERERERERVRVSEREKERER